MIVEGPAADLAAGSEDDAAPDWKEERDGNNDVPARKPRSDIGAERTKFADASTQEGAGGHEDWRSSEISRVIARLRSTNAAVRMCALKRLHIRWNHPQAARMCPLLRAGGAAPLSISEVPAMIQKCDICRKWTKPTPRSVVTARLVTEFNIEVQFDLWFYHSLIDKSHLEDTAIRLIANFLLDSKEESSLCRGISKSWIPTHGLVKVLVQDGEIGMRSAVTADWAGANSIQLKFKPSEVKAWVAERHQALLRDAAHAVESQLQKEGIFSQFETTLAMITFAHNSLTDMGGFSPYNALYGVQPSSAGRRRQR